MKISTVLLYSFGICFRCKTIKNVIENYLFWFVLIQLIIIVSWLDWSRVFVKIMFWKNLPSFSIEIMWSIWPRVWIFNWARNRWWWGWRKRFFSSSLLHCTQWAFWAGGRRAGGRAGRAGGRTRGRTWRGAWRTSRLWSRCRASFTFSLSHLLKKGSKSWITSP